jgi:integrase
MNLKKVGNRWYLRKRVDGKQHEISMRTSDSKVAKSRANRFLATLDSDGLEVAEAELRGKQVVRGGTDPTFEEMKQLYRDFVGQSMKAPAENSIRHNLGCLSRLMTMCEAATVSKINARKLKSPNPSYLASQIRAAKSIFKPQALQYYKSRKIVLPNPFATAELGSTRSEPYTPLGLPIRKAVWEGYKALPAINAMIVALALGAGLRRNEIDKARLSWLIPDGSGKTILTVKKESDFSPKSRVRRSIPITSSLAQDILQLRSSTNPRANDPYLLPNGGTTGGFRHMERYKEVSAWLRKLGISDQKPLHTLRKEFGSLVASEHGIFAASTLLGHSSIVITQNHYASLTDVPTVDMDAIIAPKEALAAVAKEHGIPLDKLKEILAGMKKTA